MIVNRLISQHLGLVLIFDTHCDRFFALADILISNRLEQTLSFDGWE